MRQILFILIIATLAIAACNSPKNPPVEEAAITLKPTDFKTLDTLRFGSDSAALVISGRNPFIVLKTAGKDTTRGVAVGIFYFENGKQLFAYKDTINVGEEVDSYQSYLGFPGYEGEDAKPCEHFFDFNFGYPACGYDQTHLLFYKTKGHCSFVAKHVSSGDGPYGYGFNFTNLCNKEAKPVIYSTIVSSAPDDNDDALIINEVSDSIKYEFDGKGWISTPVTPKDKAFRVSKERLYDEEI